MLLDDNTADVEAGGIDVTIVMPCLNEAGSLPACIQNARLALEKCGRIWGSRARS